MGGAAAVLLAYIAAGAVVALAGFGFAAGPYRLPALAAGWAGLALLVAAIVTAIGTMTEALP
jgi:hypothetical protein